MRQAGPHKMNSDWGKYGHAGISSVTVQIGTSLHKSKWFKIKSAERGRLNQDLWSWCSLE
eukprot:CAMPEP_0172162742 /NCGR_PEP_ID=MMETSP1050-20130122/6853_1 /TAXON_ID=233186 /ORGANISM="Cryptomonas curvata, Strain CCAP979/52" /LENGTH=59 /DNA_ID=CAMNT_0012832791 /DNA_START=253 /DNA_END=432 /DNA_ORIENTATION=-